MLINITFDINYLTVLIICSNDISCSMGADEDVNGFGINDEKVDPHPSLRPTPHST
jgi:hypothetical protein